MAALEYWLWLSAADVGPRAKTALVQCFGDAEQAFHASNGAFFHVPGVSKQEARILEKRDIRAAERILADCEEQKLQILTLQDARYPTRLKNIPAPPVVLYVKGRLPEVDREAVVALIGTRRASEYGRRMGRELAMQIGRGGGVVLSLLTAGVDEEVAKGALRAHCGVIGVLGTPIEGEKTFLARDVAEKGALVSEYPPGTRAQKRFFRERNRVAAGLSAGVVVVEAPEKSGALLFADEAAEQGREIFAVPGNVGETNSAGTLSLLKNGARLITCGQDVLEDLAPLFPGKLRMDGAAPTIEEEADETAEEKKEVDTEKPQGYIDLRTQLQNLDEEELQIVAAIEKGASHMDDIIDRTGLPTWKVLSKLTKLSIERYLIMRPGKFYELNITKK